MKKVGFAAGLGAIALLLWFFVLNQGGLNQTRGADNAAAITAGGEPQAGYKVLVTYSCGACHEIPGIPGAQGKIGASLDGFKDRALIAGVISNSADHLILWLRHPRQVDPQTGMPDLGLTEKEARDAAAYLYAPNH